MSRWWTIPDVITALAAVTLLVIVTWAAHARAAAHRWVASHAHVSLFGIGRAVRHARRVHAAFGGLA